MKIVIDTKEKSHRRCVLYDEEGCEIIRIPFFELKLHTYAEQVRHARMPNAAFRRKWFKRYPGKELTEEMMRTNLES